MSRHFKKIKSIFLYKSNLKSILKQIDSFGESVTFYNPETIGVMNSTKIMFSNLVALPELLNIKQINSLAVKIVQKNFKQIFFAGFTYGWNELIQQVKFLNNDIIIKVIWHGSHSMLVERDEEYFLNNLLQLHDKEKIDAIAFAKESMAEFYKLKGYNAFFLPNIINLNKEEFIIRNNIEDNIEKIKIGLYAAGDRWEKNTFNQLSAASMVKNHILDVLPKTSLVEEFIRINNIRTTDFREIYVSRNELLNRMSNNDINLYVTFTECSPLIPLESLELGVPCITGNNHHYFKGTKLSDYLVVKSEDNIDEIKEKIDNAILNKAEIIKLYKEWKNGYSVQVKRLIQEFSNYKVEGEI